MDLINLVDFIDLIDFEGFNLGINGLLLIDYVLSLDFGV